MIVTLSWWEQKPTWLAMDVHTFHLVCGIVGTAIAARVAWIQGGARVSNFPKGWPATFLGGVLLSYCAADLLAAALGYVWFHFGPMGMGYTTLSPNWPFLWYGVIWAMLATFLRPRQGMRSGVLLVLAIVGLVSLAITVVRYWHVITLSNLSGVGFRDIGFYAIGLVAMLWLYASDGSQKEASNSCVE